MIRKFVLSTVLATGALAGVTATSTTADAASPIGHDRDRDFRGGRFEVQVRHRGHWDTYGTYRDRDAQRVVRMLERQGRDARIEVERSRW